MPLEEMQAIAERFETRHAAGLQKAAPTKDLVKKAIKRQSPVRCPTRLNRLSYDVMIRHKDALADLFYEFPDDIVFVAPYHIFVGYQPPEKKDPIKPLKVLMEASEWTDEWGTRWAHAFGGVGATPIGHPIQDWSQLDNYLAHHFPDPNAPGRLDAVRKTIDTHKKTKYCMGAIQLTLFERLHCLRSMENIFDDFYSCETEVLRLLDALTEYNLQLIRAWGKIGADGLLFTDDWGTQTALMISPAMWRKFFKPLYRKIFDEVHRAGMDVCFHSCGNVTDIIADLIDIGLDILDPLQPGAMNLKEIAQKFGGHLTFHGAIDDQHLMTKSSPQELKDNIRWLIDTLGKPFNNGYILSPANSIPPETPIENLRALFEACHGK
jgi:uroporphyrinogen decarboxylase